MERHAYPRLRALLLGVVCAASGSAGSAFAQVPFCLELGVDAGIMLEPQNAAALKAAMWKNFNTVKASQNIPVLRLTNTSDSLSILDFEMTIGKPVLALFDSITVFNTPQTVNPASVNASHSSGQVRLMFAGGGLAPGESVLFRVNIGPAMMGGNQFQRFDNIFFDLDGSGDTSNNSLVTINFDDATQFAGRLPDFQSANQVPLGECILGTTTIGGMKTQYNHYTYVPEPGALGMAALGGLGLAACLWRRWRGGRAAAA